MRDFSTKVNKNHATDNSKWDAKLHISFWHKHSLKRLGLKSLDKLYSLVSILWNRHWSNSRIGVSKSLKKVTKICRWTPNYPVPWQRRQKIHERCGFSSRFRMVVNWHSIWRHCHPCKRIKTYRQECWKMGWGQNCFSTSFIMLASTKRLTSKTLSPANIHLPSTSRLCFLVRNLAQFTKIHELHY
jgi:hypothetical protein